MMRLFIMLLLVGCNNVDTNKSANTITPDGKSGVIAHCDGLTTNQSVCYEQMGKVCNKGYTILRDEPDWKLAECK